MLRAPRRRSGVGVLAPWQGACVRYLPQAPQGGWSGVRARRGAGEPRRRALDGDHMLDTWQHAFGALARCPRGGEGYGLPRVHQAHGAQVHGPWQVWGGAHLQLGLMRARGGSRWGAWAWCARQFSCRSHGAPSWGRAAVACGSCGPSTPWGCHRPLCCRPRCPPATWLRTSLPTNSSAPGTFSAATEVGHCSRQCAGPAASCDRLARPTKGTGQCVCADQPASQMCAPAGAARLPRQHRQAARRARQRAMASTRRHGAPCASAPAAPLARRIEVLVLFVGSCASPCARASQCCVRLAYAWGGAGPVARTL